MKRIIDIVILLLILTSKIFAYDFQAGQLYYSFMPGDNQKYEVCVVYPFEGANLYEGDMVIPETVSYSGINYKVTYIANKAFYGCNKLTSIRIPKSITGIASLAFVSCRKLEHVYSDIPIAFEIGATGGGNDVFVQISENATLHVPQGSLESYQKWPCWVRNFKYVVEGNNYELRINSKGSGSVSFGGSNIRNGSKSFSVSNGQTITLVFSPDYGYRVKSLKVNNKEVSFGDSYTLTINTNTEIDVEFDEKPEVFVLSISSTGGGSVSYNKESIRGATKSYSIEKGSSILLNFIPDSGNRLKSVEVNNQNISISNNSYSINNISSNTIIDVMFEELEKQITINDINYEIFSFDKRTLLLDEGNYGIAIEIPERVSYQNQDWDIIGAKSNSLNSSKDIAAIIWNPKYLFDVEVQNPNLLLYIKDIHYAPAYIKNLVVNGKADNIILTDAKSGNNFYCPRSFTTQKITYTHSYNMKTGIKESMGWETIALPFDVQKITHSTKGEIIPFAKWKKNDTNKPFWLYRLGSSGFVATDGIKANEPYIISMPNHSYYKSEYILAGSVTFSAENVTVMKSDEINAPSYNGRKFIPNYIHQDNQNTIYALNVNNDYVNYQGGEPEGSKFIMNLRSSYPFEAYMSSSSGARSIGVFDDMSTDLHSILEEEDKLDEVKVYDLRGTLITIGSSIELVKQALPSGVYIINSKKMVIK